MNKLMDSGSARIRELLPLFDRATINVLNMPEEEYDRKHPQIWQQFEKTAITLINRGYKHLGAKQICEYIRFNSPSAAEAPKISNNMTAYYSRKFVSLHPQYKDFFEFRERKENQNGNQITENQYQEF